MNNLGNNKLRDEISTQSELVRNGTEEALICNFTSQQILDIDQLEACGLVLERIISNHESIKLFGGDKKSLPFLIYSYQGKKAAFRMLDDNKVKLVHILGN
ncbi:MAG: hypothetical protein V3575_03905 [Candidatus Absconditabacteria bacterium]